VVRGMRVRAEQPGSSLLFQLTIVNFCARRRSEAQGKAKARATTTAPQKPARLIRLFIPPGNGHRRPLVDGCYEKHNFRANSATPTPPFSRTVGKCHRISPRVESDRRPSPFNARSVGGTPGRLGERMAVTWEIRGVVLIVTLTGDYGFEEPVRAVAEALANPQFKVGTSLLVDARLSHARRSSEEFRTRAKWLASLKSRGLSSRCAMVIANEPHQYGMARMAATHNEIQGLEMRIFTDFDEAFRWLSNGNSLTSSAGV